MLPFKALTPLLAVAACCAACGGTMVQASAGARFEPDSAREIDDDDVRKAFEAAPQLPERSRVAYFTFEDERAADLERMLAQVPHVSSTYRIPALLATGKRRFHESSPWEPPQELSVKKLRLLAARAHADVLVVIDYGYRSEGMNALSALNGLLLPALFVPFLSNETESYAEAHVIDVRNGYVYAELDVDDRRGSEYVTIYARTPDQMFEEAWPELVTRLGAKLAAALAPSPGPEPPAPVAPMPAPVTAPAPAPAPAPAAAGETPPV